MLPDSFRKRFPAATQVADNIGIWAAVAGLVWAVLTWAGSFVPFMDDANTATWILFSAGMLAAIILICSLSAIGYALCFMNKNEPSGKIDPEIVHEHGIKCADCGHPNVYLSSRIVGHENRVEVSLNINTTKPYAKLSVYITPQLGHCVMGGLGNSSGDCHWKNLASLEAFKMEDVPSDFSKQIVAFEIANGHMECDGVTYQLPRATRFHAVVKFDNSEDTDDIVISTVRGPNGFIAYVESYGPDLRHWSPAISA